MDVNTDCYKLLGVLLRAALNSVGPKGALKEPEQALPFKDEIMHEREYFSAGYMLRSLVIDKLPGKRDRVNDETGFRIFERLCIHMYNRIKQRETVIQKTLDQYVIDEDLSSAAAFLEQLVTTTYSTYRVVLVTNLVTLKDIDSVNVGNVLIRRIDENYLHDWPESCGTTSHGGLAWFPGNLSYYPSKEKLLEDNKDNAALEVVVTGYHFNEEQSAVFECAIAAFKRVFAYLSLCEFFLSHLDKDQYRIETKELPRTGFFTAVEPRGSQRYYLRRPHDQVFIRAIDATWKSFIFSKRTFVLTQDLVKQLKDRCCLDKFNEVFQKEDFGEIKSKLSRCLDWYLKAELESDLTDVALSLFISIEALLSPGGDPLMSHTDEMAENVAIMVQGTIDKRYEWKRAFKKRYGLRNEIAHHGKALDRDEHWSSVNSLRVDTVWSVRGILFRLDGILKYGNNSAAIRQYFEREKLK